jgi:dTDP-4-amino-4,6-dideoxygalactose transaminase
MARWPVYDEAQIARVAEVLRSGRVNAWTGPEVGDFERAYAGLLGRRHAIALANGTVALELALLALGVGPGDEVVVTPRSFVASAACAALRGARPVFADVDRDSQNLTPATVAAAITPRTRAVIVVHLAGWPADMPGLMALCRPRGIAVVEDCAQAHGAEIDGRPVGAFGDAAAFSFCQDKIVTTGGEGGLLALDDDGAWRRAWSFKDHGKSWDAVRRDDHPPGFRWLHGSLGTNWRMTGLQAALGLAQLDRLEAWREARDARARTLLGTIRALPALRAPEPPAGLRHARYRLYAFVRPERLRAGWSRDRIVAEMGALGAPCFTGSCGEIYREAAFAEAGLAPAAPLPTARELAETSIAFLVDPSVEPDEIDRVAAALTEVVGAATAASAA